MTETQHKRAQPTNTPSADLDLVRRALARIRMLSASS